MASSVVEKPSTAGGGGGNDNDEAGVGAAGSGQGTANGSEVAPISAAALVDAEKADKAKSGQKSDVNQSVANSRPTSGLPDDLTASDRSRLSSSNGGSGILNDVTASFDRMGLSSANASAGTTPSSKGARDIFGPTSAADGQQSLLQRAMNRSNIDPAALPRHVQQQQQQHSDANLTPVFNERFLFSDDELEADDSTFVKKYNLNEDDTSFPVLIRHESQPGMLSASSAALDLAPLAQTPSRFPARADANVSEWPQFANRDGPGAPLVNGVPTHEPSNAGSESFDRFASRRGRSERNSPRNVPTSAGGRGTHMTSTPANNVSTAAGQRIASNGHAAATAALVSQGFHTPQQDRSADDSQRKDQLARAGHSQDAPTANEGSGTGANAASAFAPFAMGSGFPGEVKRNNAGANAVGRFAPGYSDFHAPRGPGADPSNRSGGSDFFEAFAAPHVGKGAAQGSLGNAHKSGNAGRLPGTADAFGLGGPVDAAQNASSLKLQQRKGELDTATPLEELQGEIFALCKDQHGCRYLQKKLEEGNPSYRDMIFTETFSHFAELMTDPFGNYLCQKMLEYCTDEQRNLIVESVAPDLVNISLNMHGTRAVQKTIDFLSTPRQIHSIIMALGMNVVPLIKDLNGNHVVQKCLNRLGSSDNQFIYDAVAAHCVEVATHRHGCCVLQRCIDHASDKQRMQLVQEITFNALTLVQDPFGNYVVQYILDLNDPRYSEALVRQFVGHVCTLSIQKFSSNVIEKCIRVSEPGVRKQMIEELLNRTRLEKLLRDSFANYVVQTSLDYADPVQRMQLVECIKPTLPMIRNTPYGKRIQSKLQRDNIDLGPVPGNVPYGMMHHAAAAAAAHQQQMHAMAAMQQRGGPGGGGGGDFGPQYGASGGNGGYHMGSAGRGGGGGGGGGFGGRQGGGGALGHIPPAAQSAMYGGSRGGGDSNSGYGGAAGAGFGAPGQSGGGYGRHGNGGGFGGSHQQNQYGSASAAGMQNGFAAGPHHHQGGGGGGGAASYGGAQY